MVHASPDSDGDEGSELGKQARRPGSGHAEVDEMFVGGKAINMHKGCLNAMRAQMPADRARATKLPATTTRPS